MASRDEVKALLHEFSERITPLVAHLHLAMSPQVCADERRRYALVTTALEEANDIAEWIRARIRQAAAIEASRGTGDLHLRRLPGVSGNPTTTT